MVPCNLDTSCHIAEAVLGCEVDHGEKAAVLATPRPSTSRSPVQDHSVPATVFKAYGLCYILKQTHVPSPRLLMRDGSTCKAVAEASQPKDEHGGSSALGLHAGSLSLMFWFGHYLLVPLEAGAGIRPSSASRHKNLSPNPNH